jgi:hypothetical protein
MAFKDTVKTWFQTGLKPTQGQFWSWMDKLRWKDEPIAITEVTGLQDFLNALGPKIQRFEATGTFRYTIPVGFIVEWLLVKPTLDCTVTIDDGNGNASNVDVIALHGEPITCMYNAGEERVIEITNLPLKTLVFVKRYQLPSIS